MSKFFTGATSLALLFGFVAVIALSQSREIAASEPDTATESKAWHNDLNGTVQGQIDFAQSHVVSARRELFDPLLVPQREALVIFKPPPLFQVRSANMIVKQGGIETIIPMAPPERFPKSAVYDQSNTFSGKPIEGVYPKFREYAYTATIPYYLFSELTRLSFFINDQPGVIGTLDLGKTVFLRSESNGLALMNIKGCIFKLESDCRTVLDQYDKQKNPQLAAIAAREMFSELPVRQLILGMGQSYWPYVIAKDADGKPRRYSRDAGNYKEWAELGDKTLPAKVGMGIYWRAASDLGDKQPGKFVAISGQLLDVPDDIEVLPPGVGASCGGSSCNYPWYPAGYWHETGHGLGLPHNTPPRYERWAYRSYDLKMLPNYHSNPISYGMAVDYLGYNYFGHVLGALTQPAWPPSPASAPLVDEFEHLRSSNPSATRDWKHYIAPYTHQQTLRVQQRFGSFPDGLEYADILDDLRPAPTAVQASVPSEAKTAEVLIDSGMDETPHDSGTLLKRVRSGEEPILKGVPVLTLVMTMSAAEHDLYRISQIYPPIVSNYGNVFAVNTRGYATDDPIGSATSTYTLRVEYADHTADVSVLYQGNMNSNDLFSIAVNVPRERKPRSAELLRNGTVVSKRMLDEELDLPPPDVVGAEAGYPLVTPHYLRSRVSSLCLSRTPTGLTQATCNIADTAQKWGMPEVLSAAGETFTLTGTTSAACLDLELNMPFCFINEAGNQWRDRKDLASQGTIKLQNVKNGRFVTAHPNRAVDMQALTNGAEQEFERVGSDQLSGSYNMTTTGSDKCLTRVADRLELAGCADEHQQQWVTGMIEGSEGPPGPYFNIASPDGSQCLRDGLKITSCDAGANDQRWSRRTDLSGLPSSYLQNLASGTFITASQYYESLTQQSYLPDSPYKHQEFNFTPTNTLLTPAQRVIPASEQSFRR